MKKRVMSLLLTVCLAFSGLAVSAQTLPVAVSVDGMVAFSPTDFAKFAAAKNDGIMLSADSLTLNDICRDILDFKSEISVYELGIVADGDGFNASRLLSTLVESCPELFILETYGYTVSSDGYIDTIYPYYYYSVEECKQKLTQFDKILDKIVDDISPEATDLQKVLYLHDYLVLNSEYASGISDAYGFLTEGYGVCQGYALAFCALARKAGLNCYQGLSEKQNHIWNMVEVEDQYYHIDVTWGDPISDRVGRVSYKYFMMSTTDMLENALSGGITRDDWRTIGDVPIECLSEKYDVGYVWEDNKQSIVCLNGEYYEFDFSSGASLNRVSADFSSSETVLVLEERHWYINDRAYFSDFCSGLFVLGNAIYANYPDALLRMYIKNGGFVAETVDISSLIGETDLDIYGSHYYKEKGQIILQYNKYALNGDNSVTLELSTRSTIDIPLLAFDNATWATVLVGARRCLLGERELDSPEMYDINGDGEINIIDLVSMKKRSVS